MTNHNEDPLESLLDEQSDDEFGMPEIRDKFDHGASVEKHGNLKTWSAEDFSSIYVRFYPHLVRHAKRFLTSDVQAEEVVQDAFLYMMTALPEIDSELGVLKFMKWKVRLLALDVIRATPNRRETLVDSFDDEQSAEETDSEIERADDMAVIGAALAKLNPRHREVLIATVYEEKSSTEVAVQMQLSENATRQLVFRARAAFKKALVGEAEVAGRSISEILSIAARKAASGAKEHSRALSLVFILALGLSWVPTIGAQLDQPGELVAEPAIPDSGARLDSLGEPLDSGPTITPDVETPGTTDVPKAVTDVEPLNKSDSASQAELITLAVAEDQANNSANANDSALDVQTGDGADQSIAELEIATILGQTTGQGLVIEQSTEPNFQTNGSGIPIELRSNSGLQAFFFFDPENKEISNLVLRVEVSNKPYFGIPGQFGYGFSEDSSTTSITHTSSSISFVDQFGEVRNIPELNRMVVSIQVNLDALDRPTSSNLTVRLFS